METRETEHSDILVNRVTVKKECTYDEAIQVEEIAKKMMMENDFEGAHKLALKTLELFPDLDNVSQILAICEVLCSAQRKINGAQMDLYGILQVDSYADDATISRQFKKLALLLHCDKNKFPGAKAAFDLICEANTILSDKWKRYLHDFKCNDYEKPTTPEAKNQNQNGDTNSKSDNTDRFTHESVTRSRKRSRASCGEEAGDDLRPGEQSNLSSSGVKNDKIEEKNNADSKDDPGYEEKERDCFEVDQIWACYDDMSHRMPRRYAQIQKVYKLRFKMRITWLKPAPETHLEEGLPVSCGKFVCREREETRDRIMFSHRVAYEKDGDLYKIYPRKGEIWALFKDRDITWTSDTKSHTKNKIEIVEVLSDFENGSGVVASMVKVKGFVSLFQITSPDELAGRKIPSNELFRFSHRVPSVKLTGTEHADVPVGSFELDNASLPVEAFSNDFTETSEVSSTSGGNVGKIVIHDFCLDKKDRIYLNDQIWALGRSENGITRCYARIREIESESTPVKFHITVLELCTAFNDAIRPDMCGQYKAVKAGRQIVLEDFLLYLVEAQVAGKNRFDTYPNVEEIWVLYNTWDSNCIFSNMDAGECEIVEVVEKNRDMIKVLCLSRVPGYKSVFRAPMIENSNSRVLEIPIGEFNRFGYRVPAFLLTNEHDGRLRGSWELDLDYSRGKHGTTVAFWGSLKRIGDSFGDID